MGTINDPIYVKVSSFTQSPDGTSRTDVFNMTSTLNNYSGQLAANLATPLYNQIIAEQKAAGTLSGGSQYAAGDAYSGTAAGGPVSLRAEIGVGAKSLATPLRYALVRYDTLAATPFSSNLTVGGQYIYNWLDGILTSLVPFYLYQGIQVR